MLYTYWSSLKHAHKFIGNEFEHPQGAPKGEAPDERSIQTTRLCFLVLNKT